MKNYSPTIIEDMLPEASGVYNIGSAEKTFAEGHFDNLYGNGSNLTGISTSQSSVSMQSIFLLMGA